MEFDDEDRSNRKRKLEDGATDGKNAHYEDDNEIDEDAVRFVEQTPAGESLDSSQIKKMVLSLEKKINFNQIQRAKFADTPEKFMESEVDLDDEIKKLSVLASAPELYKDFIALGVIPSLLSLLPHENIDISIDVVDLFHELTDADIVTTAETDDMKAFSEALVSNQALELLIQNIKRFDETQSEEASAVHNTLGLVENLVDIDPKNGDLLCEKTELQSYLLKRVTSQGFDENKLYASEILAILLQASKIGQQNFGKQGGLEDILVTLSSYKKVDPASLEEEEMVENLFDCLCSSLQSAENREEFVKQEGIELLLIMIKKKKFTRKSALKALDYVLLKNPTGCDRFVDQLGLKTLFAAYMKKGSKKNRKGFDEEKDEEHILSSIVSLFRNGSSGNIKRLVGKFTENTFEKVERLVELHLKYSQRVKEFEDQKREEMEGDEIDEDDMYLDRLDSGLFTLQLADLTISYVCFHAKETKIRSRIVELMNQYDSNLDEVKAIMQEYLDAKDATNVDEYDAKLETEEKKIISELTESN